MTGTVAVSGVLGTAGSVAQAWTSRTGPQDVTNRYDYLAAANTPYGADFVAAGAQMAQQLTDVGTTNALQWLYFTEDPRKGQLDYGFYNPASARRSRSRCSATGSQDFPASIHYGDIVVGNDGVRFDLQPGGLGDYPDQITYTSTDTVDAFGVITLPNIGFLDCLRVHEVVEYDIAIDLGDGYADCGTEYVLNYYWLAPGHGMSCKSIPSSATRTPPDDLGGPGGRPRADVPG